jgi:hypothetical protein
VGSFFYEKDEIIGTISNPRESDKIKPIFTEKPDQMSYRFFLKIR